MQTRELCSGSVSQERAAGASSLVCTDLKAHYDRNGSRSIELQQFKNFQKYKFLNDLEKMPWRNVSSHSDPNDMWQEWKNLFVSCMDKQAPLKDVRAKFF